MKKTRFFSRIFAAVLAVAVMTTTLATNSGAGLFAFAAEGGEGGNNKGYEIKDGSGGEYSVKIISPDVPAGEYKYVFYQIFTGEVLAEEDLAEDDKNILGNAEWGDGLLGMDQEVVVVDEDHKFTREDALFNLLTSNNTNAGWTNSEGNFYFNNSNSYSSSSVFYQYANANIQAYDFADNTTNRYPKSAAGLVTLLNDVNNGKLCNTSITYQTAYLRTFAELLLNGGQYQSSDNSFKFIGNEAASVTFGSKSNETDYTVKGLKAGYYLVACVDAKTGDLTNAAGDAIKPMSAMLVMVGPANEGVAEIVGKNATSVPTVDLQIYKEKVDVTDLTADGETEDGKIYDENYNASYNSTIIDLLKEHKLPDNFITDDDWSKTQSLGYEYDAGANGYLLYRVGITLPENFDSYKDIGYVLAFINAYDHSGASSVDITRLKTCRPQVYVVHKDDTKAEYVGSLSSYTSSTSNYKEAGAIGLSYTSSGILVGNNNYNNFEIASKETECFVLGNLYSKEYDDINFEPGDKIYIYYPASVNNSGNKYTYGPSSNTGIGKCLLNTSRVRLVYSNDPYAEKESDNSEVINTSTAFKHGKSGALATSPIAESNVNNYNVNLKVSGSDENYQNGAQFVLYRINSAGEKEYAAISTSYTYTIKEWIPEDDDRLTAFFDENGNIKVDTILNIPGKSSDLRITTSSGITTGGHYIYGLAAGTYYLEEVSLSASGSSYNAKHDNTEKFYYHLSQAPIKLVIENEYNSNVTSFTEQTIGQFIQKLSITFVKEMPTDRYVKAYINKPAADDGTTPNTGTLTTNLNIVKNDDGIDTEKTHYATADGNLEIEVRHIPVNLLWLPETGGIGTMIFFIVGGAIVVTAVVLIVTRFRVKRERL